MNGGVSMNAISDDELRAELRAWLGEHWTEAAKARAHTTAGVWDQSDDGGWSRKVFEARWAVPRWPAQWFGRDFSQAQADIVEQEFARAGAPGAGLDRTHLAANTILKYGQDAAKRDLLPALLTDKSGGALTCLLYSEPGAGSDLAAVRARAERDGDDWVINGQKVWTSGAKTADYGFLIARTNWDVPKHQGISFFVLPMKQPGVDIRPIHQITGDAHFNEVFLDNARVPAAYMLGAEGEGWKVLQTALAYERLIMGELSNGSDEVIDLIGMAREAGRLDDAVLRQDIARAIALRQLNVLNMARATADVQQGTSSPLMSLGKLAMSRILHGEARVMTSIIGAQALLDGPDHALAQEVNGLAFWAYMTSIGGGSDQIQRNIISERVLGLPREPDVDRNIPFRESRAVKG